MHPFWIRLVLISGFLKLLQTFQARGIHFLFCQPQPSKQRNTIITNKLTQYEFNLKVRNEVQQKTMLDRQKYMPLPQRNSNSQCLPREILEHISIFKKIYPKMFIATLFPVAKQNKSKLFCSRINQQVLYLYNGTPYKNYNE